LAEKEPAVSQPLTDYVRLIAEVAGEKAARTVLVEHAASCPMVKEVRNLVTEVWGNGKPGLKSDLQAVKNTVESLRDEKKIHWGWIVGLATILGWCVITGLSIYSMKR
jgi:hypothetical protein